MRLVTGEPRATSTVNLLKLTNTLSIHQLVAFQTLVMVNKVVTNSKPAYLARKLTIRNGEGIPERSKATIIQPNQTLSITRGGFMFRGIQLFNSLPIALRLQRDSNTFKTAVRSWVENNIPAKPV